MKYIKIKAFEVRIDDTLENGKQAELVGLDEVGNEYRLRYNWYEDGQNKEIVPQIICTESSLIK